MPTQKILDRDLALIEAAAARGERCPQSYPHGPLNAASSGVLARAGRIKVAIYAHNWRVVTIMEGPNKGKRTMASPYDGSGRPYKVIYLDHIRLDTRISRLQAAR